MQKEHKKLHREFGPWLRADGTSMTSTIFGKLDTNISGMGSFTKSHEGESPVPCQSNHAVSTKVAVVTESDESETLGTTAEAGRDTWKKKLDKAVEVHSTTINVGGEQTDSITRGDDANNVGDKCVAVENSNM